MRSIDVICLRRRSALHAFAGGHSVEDPHQECDRQYDHQRDLEHRDHHPDERRQDSEHDAERRHTQHEQQEHCRQANAENEDRPEEKLDDAHRTVGERVAHQYVSFGARVPNLGVVRDKRYSALATSWHQIRLETVLGRGQKQI